eukprot:gnl/MRDRNA2_/MRDRNA2_51730_c0_seq1.p1 gnl/MRDRNA2_/MRDRNA2_51730_c0~~gnl/MRDRNA2_/MRDRNA2_51730_c0_seq1.p1  ORF type:complete len:140 (-),score=19.44 gnl/MRDRNA2_/MRDRNA2_51730_c0_seq1:4-423(-)
MWCADFAEIILPTFVSSALGATSSRIQFVPVSVWATKACVHECSWGHGEPISLPLLDATLQEIKFGEPKLVKLIGSHEGVSTCPEQIRFDRRGLKVLIKDAATVAGQDESLVAWKSLERYGGKVGIEFSGLNEKHDRSE